MLYKLNPVKAVYNMKKWGPRDINGISDSCYGICAAFSSGDDAFNIQPECEKSCKEYIEQRKHEIYGVGSCDHQAPYRPVIWDNIPRFVPKLMKKGKTPEEALCLGKKMCEKLPTLYNECVDLCNLDYSAVELNEKYTSTESKNGSIDSSDNKCENSYDKLIMGIFIVTFIVCLYVLFVKIFGKTN